MFAPFSKAVSQLQSQAAPKFGMLVCNSGKRWFRDFRSNSFLEGDDRCTAFCRCVNQRHFANVLPADSDCHLPPVHNNRNPTSEYEKDVIIRSTLLALASRLA